jgi:DNA-binding response OmpR family regulator
MPDTDDHDTPLTLVVDDEKEVADAYALRLRGACAVETAYGGREALTVVEDRPVDIVLLDRHMPDISGDTVLAELDERGFDGRVVMVTAIDPDFDVLDLPFDDYLCKPIDREDVRDVVDQQRQILAYETLGEFFSVKSTKSVLEAETSPDQREGNDDFQSVARRADRLEHRARRLLDDESVIDRFEGVDRGGR